MTKKRKRGRPSKYISHYERIAYMLCADGATDKELSQILGVSKSTINRWKHDHPYFWDSLKKGKMIACAKIVAALYELAMGYITTETRTYYNAQNEVYKIEVITKELPANVKAAKFLLEMKYPEVWKV